MVIGQTCQFAGFDILFGKKWLDKTGMYIKGNCHFGLGVHANQTVDPRIFGISVVGKDPQLGKPLPTPAALPTEARQ